MKKKIGKRLRTIRMERHFTQEDIEKETGIDRTTISSFELGKRNMSIENLILLANFYEVSADYILCLNDRRFIDTTELNSGDYNRILHILNKK